MGHLRVDPRRLLLPDHRGRLQRDAPDGGAMRAAHRELAAACRALTAVRWTRVAPAALAIALAMGATRASAGSCCSGGSAGSGHACCSGDPRDLQAVPARSSFDLA